MPDHHIEDPTYEEIGRSLVSLLELASRRNGFLGSVVISVRSTNYTDPCLDEYGACEFRAGFGAMQDNFAVPGHRLSRRMSMEAIRSMSDRISTQRPYLSGVLARLSDDGDGESHA